MGARAAAGTVDRDRSGGAAPRPLMSPPRRCSSLAALRTQGPSCERARVAEELTVAFDALHTRIVAALVDDATATDAEVAARVGLSPPALNRPLGRRRARCRRVRRVQANSRAGARLGCCAGWACSWLPRRQRVLRQRREFRWQL